MYGKIKESKLLNIKVYKDNEVIYEGKVEDAPENIGNLNYKSVNIKDEWVIYQV